MDRVPTADETTLLNKPLASVCATTRLSTVAVASPVHHLIDEHAKSAQTLQQLQNEVATLLAFRDLVMEILPQLGQKVPDAATEVTASGSRWQPGIRVRRKLGHTHPRESDLLVVPSLVSRYRCPNQGKVSRCVELSTPTYSNITVQDSGFCAESNKEHSSSSAAALGARFQMTSDCADDELLSLLDSIQHKGTRLKSDAHYFRARLFCGKRGGPLTNCACEKRCATPGDFGSANSVARSFATFECGLKMIFLQRELRKLKCHRQILLKKLQGIEAEHLVTVTKRNCLLAQLEMMAAEKRRLREKLNGRSFSSKNVDDGGEAVVAAAAKFQPNDTFLACIETRGPRTSFANDQRQQQQQQLLKLKQFFKMSHHRVRDIRVGAGSRDPTLKRWWNCRPLESGTAEQAENLVSREVRNSTSCLTGDDIRSKSNTFVDCSSVTSATVRCRTLPKTDNHDEPRHIVSSDGGGLCADIRVDESNYRVNFSDRQSCGSTCLRRGTSNAISLSKVKVLGILTEYDTSRLQCYLLTLSYQMEALKMLAQRVTKSRVSVFEQLRKYKCENEDLKLELKKKEIELEGTKAQKRILERKRSSNTKLSYSTSDLISSSASKSSTRPKLSKNFAYECSVCDFVIVNEESNESQQFGSIGNGAINALAGAAADRRNDRGTKYFVNTAANRVDSYWRNFSKIPLKTNSSRLPVKSNCGGGLRKMSNNSRECSLPEWANDSCILSMPLSNCR